MSFSFSADHSSTLYSEAQTYLPGGVNSPVRNFQAVGGHPLFIQKARGAYLYDVDGNHYIDYVGAWGPMILGHAHPCVLAAVQKALENGFCFGAPCETEITLAKIITHCMPFIEKIRMMSSGTEATMTAIRVARAATKRNKIIKLEGNYHGHADALLVKSGSGTLTFGQPTSAGIPSEIIAHTLVAPFNSLPHIEMLFEQYGKEIAAIIVEPIPANMNLILPLPNYLQGLREICDHYKSLLIFDEVISGFRVALGGAQTLYNVQPDLTTLGKIIGGGFPVGALGGKKEYLELLAPIGPVYQAGTLSGHPLAMAAGVATLRELLKPNFYEQLNATTVTLASAIQSLAQKTKTPLIVHHACGLLGLFFKSPFSTILSYEEVKHCDVTYFSKFFHHLLEKNIYLPPSAFETLFISSAHGALEIDKTLNAIEMSFNTILCTV